MLYSVITGAVLDFLLNLVCIPVAGAAGAAFATMIAEFIVLFVQLIYTRNLIAEMWWRFRLPIYMGISFVAGIASYSVKKAGINSAFFALLLSAVIFFVIYGLGLLIMKEETAWEAAGYILKKQRKSKRK